MTTKRDRLLASIGRKRKVIADLDSQVSELEIEVAERLSSLAPLVSPVEVGDRLMFERRVSGQYSSGYRPRKLTADRYQPECWEVTKIGARTHSKYGKDDGLHWTARLIRIRKDGTRGKAREQFLYCKEGEMSVPHLYDSFKLGGKAPTRGMLQVETIRNFRIEPAAEVER